MLLSMLVKLCFVIVCFAPCIKKITDACYFLQLSRLLQRAHKVQGDRCQKQQLSPKLALFTAGPTFRLVKVLSWANFQFCEGSTLGALSQAWSNNRKGTREHSRRRRKSHVTIGCGRVGQRNVAHGSAPSKDQMHYARKLLKT